MNLMLKIVQGPNAGAEIALVDGLCITLGRSDSCDIVLADSLLPAEPVQLETQSDGVAMTAPGEGRVHLKPYHVVTIGATSFAVGPADGPWEPLVWPKAEEPTPAEKPAESEPTEPPSPAEEPKADEEPPKKGCGLGCALVVIVLLVILLLLAWLFFRLVGHDEISSRFDEWVSKAKEVCSRSSGGGDAEAAKEPPKVTLESLVRQYALVETNVNGRSVLRGNFRTRAERLAAAGGIYALKPGADLDLSDDESFRTAAEDLLFTLTEGSLKVVAATNRVLALSGTSPSVVVLKKTLRAVAADLPRLENVDCSAVRLGDCMPTESDDGPSGNVGAVAADWEKARKPVTKPAVAANKGNSFNPPLCGILMTPYPCLVLRSGARVLEGATFAGSTIVKIEADSVTVTNATGRFTWKP